MDLRTGKIYKGDIDEIKKSLGHNDVEPIIGTIACLTEKQKREMKVSLKDHRSKAGIQLTKGRQKMLKSYRKQQRKKRRKQNDK